MSKLIDVHELNEKLMSGLVEVTFNKADGTEREMLCTKNFDLIPADQHPAPSTVEHDYVDLMKVYDVEADGWRSFKPSRLIGAEYD